MAFFFRSGRLISGGGISVGGIKNRRGYHPGEPSPLYKVFKSCATRVVHDVVEMKANANSGCGRRFCNFMTRIENRKLAILNWAERGAEEGGRGQCRYTCIKESAKDFANTYTSAILGVLFTAGSVAKFIWDVRLNQQTARDLGLLSARVENNRTTISRLENEAATSMSVIVELMEEMEKRAEELKKEMEKMEKKIEKK